MNDDQARLNTFLSSQQFMTIAVTLDDGRPWLVPVRIGQRDGRVFGWDSKTDAEHSKAIVARPDIAMTIWTAPGEGAELFGFYARATARMVSEKNGIGRYEATVQECWINDATFMKRRVDLSQ